MQSLSEGGLCGIDTDVSKAFLSLQPCPQPSAGNTEILDCYVQLIEAFENLCNLNLRDREFAIRHIDKLVGSPIEIAFPQAFKAIQLWSAGDITGTRAYFKEHIKNHPIDFAALFMVLSRIFRTFDFTRRLRLMPHPY